MLYNIYLQIGDGRKIEVLTQMSGNSRKRED